MTLLFTCTKCLDSGGGIAIIIVVAVFFMGAGIALCKYLVSGEMVDARQGIIHSVAKRLPREFIKIIVVVWQILTQVRGAINCIPLVFWVWPKTRIGARAELASEREQWFVLENV